MGLLQVKRGHFRFVPMALFTVVLLFSNVAFPPCLCFVYFGLLRWQDPIDPVAALSKDSRKFMGVGVTRWKGTAGQRGGVAR